MPKTDETGPTPSVLPNLQLGVLNPKLHNSVVRFRSGYLNREPIQCPNMGGSQLECLSASSSAIRPATYILSDTITGGDIHPDRKNHI
jgi:hypothetical protein